MVHADVMVKKFFCSWWVLDWGWVFLLFCLKWISTNKEIMPNIYPLPRFPVAYCKGCYSLDEVWAGLKCHNERIHLGRLGVMGVTSG